MNDPQRLLDGAGTSFERNLLAADRAEMPDADAKRRAAVALAIGTASMWPAAVATTTKASKVTTSLLVKLFAIGAVGAGALGTGYYLHSRSVKPATNVAQVSTPNNPGPIATEQANDTASSAKELEPAAPVGAVEPERPAVAPRRAAGAAASAPAERASISDEIRMLDAARRAQASGDPAGAIKALDEYKKQYPRGVLAEESVLIRIEALAKMGNRAGARSLAQKFRAAHPDSPHLRRIDSILSEP